MNKVLSLAYFAGGSKFTLDPFIALKKSRHDLKVTFTKSPKRAGRGKRKGHNLLLDKAMEFGIPIKTIDDFIKGKNKLREKFQVVILSDTFHDVAKPLMKKLGYPFLLCHNLKVIDDEIVSYEFRHPQAKKQAIESFKSLGYRCFAAGDSHNDIQMFEVADKGFFINAPLKISSKHPEIESYDNYNDLEKAIYSNSIFVQT